MVIAGSCLYIDKTDEKQIINTAKALRGIVDVFRCKLIGGGTSPKKYTEGIGYEGLNTLLYIQKKWMPVATEIQTCDNLLDFQKLDWLWLGCRNSQNYELLKELYFYDNKFILKRGTNMTIDETIGLYDIMDKVHGKRVYIIERGINTFDRLTDSRWSPDLKGVIRLKNERPDIFKRLIIDCSHSVGKKEYIADTYKAFKAIGVNHYMFECTIDGKSKTDSRQMLSVKELRGILK